MSSRVRDKRRRGSRYTGVWRGSSAAVLSPERAPIQHGVRDQFSISWRLVSLFIIVCLAAVLVLFFISDAFYVRSVSIGGLRYLTKEEVFAFADIANLHLFWIDPDVVEQNVLRSPGISEARVSLGWPPNMVQIVITEREPALIWKQEGVSTWVDLQGRIMALREDRPDLIQVVADADGLIEGTVLPEALVIGALQLHDGLPQMTELRYSNRKGLGYKDENGWDIWFGLGTGMAEKVLIYQTLASDLQRRGTQPGWIDVSNPDAVVYNVLWGREE